MKKHIQVRIEEMKFHLFLFLVQLKKEEIKTSYVIGGPNSVSNEVLGNLPNAKRINGIDRNETNAKVIETFYTQKELNNAYVAKNGMGKEDQLIDALAVGV